MEPTPVDISVYRTPNPTTLKYILSREDLIPGSAFFRSAEEAQGRSPLAKRFFGCDGVQAVMFGPGFVSITYDSPDELIEKNNTVMEAFKEHLESGEDILAPGNDDENADEDETSKKIREILDRDIRPAVAGDGGDIVFMRYEDGIAYVFMQGACSGCPHATMTLKQGVEGRLKEEIPDLKEVVALV